MNMITKIRLPYLTSILLFLFITACRDDNDNPAVKRPAPVVTSIHPTSGPKTTIVTIEGANFSPVLSENLVTINGKPAIVNEATSTQLVVTVQPATGTGPVIVQVNDQESQDKPLFDYTWMVETFAGSSVSGNVNGFRTEALFSGPTDIAFDEQGNFFITEIGNRMIRKIDFNGNVTHLSGSGTNGYQDGSAQTARFQRPFGITWHDDNLYVTDGQSHMVRKVSMDGTVVTLAGSLDAGTADGVGTHARFNTPKGIRADDNGSLFVADILNNKIRIITPSGVVSTYKAVSSATDVVSLRDSMMVTSYEHKIYKIVGDEVTLFAGGSEGFSDGTTEEAKFDIPIAIEVDSRNNIYVLEFGNHTIRRITPSGEVSVVAGRGLPGYKDGAGKSASFNEPSGMAIDKDGVLYVADTDNHCIRKID